MKISTPTTDAGARSSPVTNRPIPAIRPPVTCPTELGGKCAPASRAVLPSTATKAERERVPQPKVGPRDEDRQESLPARMMAGPQAMDGKTRRTVVSGRGGDGCRRGSELGRQVLFELGPRGSHPGLLEAA